MFASASCVVVCRGGCWVVVSLLLYLVACAKHIGWEYYYMLSDTAVVLFVVVYRS